MINCGIYITKDSGSLLLELESKRTDESFYIIDTASKEFLLEHACEAIAKAYIASSELMIIILIAPRFSVIAQNKLLKIIEEPPPNKAFILITESKDAILPTIKSRLPMFNIKSNIQDDEFELDLNHLLLENVFAFISKHQKTSHKDAKILVQKIAKNAIKSQKFEMNSELLELFSKSIFALDVGSPVGFVLTTLLLKLLSQKRR